MKQVIVIAQIAVSVLIIISVLIQNRGSGLSSVFGGGNIYRTKRGLERGLFILTVILVILFIAIGALNLVISS
ncbi:MAG: preprotein translocase subunit SecG [Candidatus Doudnabacteria bacterium RIFCSPHIGHO2_02_FULL_48_21]|uniref:Protein-export membrane protein SecG n=1 Tax=Candidatus Doudnabacteria bacterium RIFCSPLOWO2_02_FULL_48_13 TaxID=1817845 RepID=A0A1F5QDT0_9BACT|nr:MAG: preprotein translocase subunit SecG [Candidatus Doudnabacteria bacterium RIFCSPHIGHO2_01_48_18]OGE77461.1 MAG: preprotein translocase subunit SecG [Candidatus Doudnabacteria bacterium RIFCSPHIGHO2_01_FULL_48_180]OGE91560.1 MAG: preprotein translocase subunit SecG [Candidatus Doudnabacteria bacterium RIFCSPHIGHO2_12_FULL_47_25]OGE93150.1 MAG: preprotein translocase subunit SecG [Candidatus Doudnabacteria bacterium RIFCSPHIGHO2_02_FULL_48_21]OGE97252.1 MAG: preprotein translocase subunit 